MTVREQIVNSLDKFLANCKNTFTAIANVVDNCASTSTTMPLSANQGKVLQDQITELNTDLEWKAIGNGSSLGNFTVSIPSDANEILIMATQNNGGSFPTAQVFISNGGAYNIAASFYYNASYFLNATYRIDETTISTVGSWTAGKNGSTDITINNLRTYLYYR